MWWGEPIETVVENATPEWTPLSLICGILLTLLGAFVISVGSLLDAAEQHWRESHQIQLNSCTREALIGIGLVLVGNLFHIAGLWFAPASLLAPTNAMGLVSSHILSSVFFNEPITIPAIISTIGISVGIIVCGISSANAGAVGMTAETRHKFYLSTWLDPSYQIFIVFLMALSIGLYIFSFHLETRQTAEEFHAFRDAPHFSAYELIPNEIQAQALARQPEAEDTTALTQAQGNLLGLLAGVIGSQTVCEIKEVECLFNQVILHGFRGLIENRTALVAVPLLCICGLGQWPFLNLAYRVGSPQLVSACYYVSWTVLGSIGGFIKFKEHYGMTFREKVIYATGLTINLASILVVCYKSIQDLTRIYFPTQPTVDNAIKPRELQTNRARVLANYMAAPFMDRVMPGISFATDNKRSQRATTIEMAAHRPATGEGYPNVSI
eukprot:Protomagalhaensia_sp_Gyna_25__2052@NODE_20_length_7955_cov_303_925088_g13_i0_p3_GENE_NODE_20_length_7955_cov_303_925088_g13_i0NODE_20_length_7955_cov_303_925088_g13_i0_p3_ORF_typecomplete_len439_score35_27Mg_trans_NIPA/PF05653_14/1_8e27EamA/PF00892_20/0_0003EamA/PF00892_20/2e03EamA/PF00892_20/6_4TPT/PF03151_16/0_0048Tetraspanin/PF00335_20/0_11UAA/PF08449_11/0_038PUNUT/PF16913_5/0_16DUF1980/PF09323_10/25DUF1980/PF09323_10/9_8Multi_Drug_Res/PF00893_19/0_36Multi_Drug_Res/PF00893_19/7_3e02Multi_Drug